MKQGELKLVGEEFILIALFYPLFTQRWLKYVVLLLLLFLCCFVLDICNSFYFQIY